MVIDLTYAWSIGFREACADVTRAQTATLAVSARIFNCPGVGVFVHLFCAISALQHAHVRNPPIFFTKLTCAPISPDEIML
jgi:hypothetical protein